MDINTKTPQPLETGGIGQPKFTPTEQEQIERTFTYHAPKGDQQTRYVQLREKAKELAYLIASNCPASREKSLAMTSLQQATMWANASIAINE